LTVSSLLISLGSYHFLFQAGLLSAVIAAFVVPKLDALPVNPAKQSVYYQQQSAQMLAQLSQQIASIGTQIPLNSTHLSPYPAFRPSASDRRVTVFWLVSLVCSLSAALLSALVQQWVRDYMRVYERPRKPLRKTRIRDFLFEDIELLPVLADAAFGLVHISLFCFFNGLVDAILNIDIRIGVITAAPILICESLYLCGVIAPLTNPHSSYRSPFSGLIWYIIRKLRHTHGTMIGHEKMEARQEQLAMKQIKGRKVRDVQAVRWLFESINGSNEMESFVLAIPGTFNQEWGREIWRAISAQGVPQPDRRGAQPTPPTDNSDHAFPGLTSPPEGTLVGDLCRYVQYLFATYNDEGYSMDREARHSRIHGWIETAASLVCCTEVPLGWFGEVGEVLSAVGHTERTNEALTIRSNPPFAVRWTSLSLVAIRQVMMAENTQNIRVRALAGFAVSGIARFQLDYGAPDTSAFNGAQRIDEYLKTAWMHIEDIHREFEPGVFNIRKPLAVLTYLVAL
jgi:hypothetical protein